MSRAIAASFLLACLAGAVFLSLGDGVESPTPSPAPVLPAPVDPPPPKPRRPCPPNRPCPRDSGAPVGAEVGGRDSAIDADLPLDLHQRNTGGSDGAGLCVFASMKHAGLWQGDPVFAAAFDYMRAYPGGGYPEKVDRVVSAICAERGLPKPRYIQIQGYDRDAMIAACKSGRMVCGTYFRSPTGRYGGATIAHMVNYPHADESGCWVLDNNYPGTYEKMTWAECERYCRPNWLIILLNPAPPAPPRN